MAGVPYITCLVCGKLTPIDRGRCYHCHSPLPSEVKMPPGYVICMNCLRVTPADSGFCRHCRAPFPQQVVEYSSRILRKPVTANIESGEVDGRLNAAFEYWMPSAPRQGNESSIKGDGRGSHVARVE
ncbi:MAG: hypothetical protein F7B17_00820 [Desulfurococcales archaeon]|nr:hypothetical protein [Desulfurococcales archaeon]